MNQKRRMSSAFLASTLIHAALILLITGHLTLGGMLGLNGSKADSAGKGSQGISADDVPVELLPNPADEKKEKDKPKIEKSKPDITTADPANVPPGDSQKCPDFYGGIGIILGTDGFIIEVADGYPAARAGIVPGDVIEGDTKYIKGKIGTPVDVVILRDGKTLKFSLIRAKICITKKKEIK